MDYKEPRFGGLFLYPKPQSAYSDCPNCGKNTEKNIIGALKRYACSGQSISERVWPDTCMEIANYEHYHVICKHCKCEWVEV